MKDSLFDVVVRAICDALHPHIQIDSSRRTFQFHEKACDIILHTKQILTGSDVFEGLSQKLHLISFIENVEVSASNFILVTLSRQHAVSWFLNNSFIQTELKEVAVHHGQCNIKLLSHRKGTVDELQQFLIVLLKVYHSRCPSCRDHLKESILNDHPHLSCWLTPYFKQYIFQYDDNPLSPQISFSPSSDKEFSQFYESRRKIVHTAYAEKYGDGHDCFHETVETLTKASIKLELLSRGRSSTTAVSLEQTSSFHEATFVLYNFVRASSLVAKMSEKLQISGEETAFALKWLTKDEEWRLVWLQLDVAWEYLNLLRTEPSDTGQNSSRMFSKVVHSLNVLAHAWSVFYNSHRVDLRGEDAATKELVIARGLLCQWVQRVLDSVLAALNVETVATM